MGVPLQLQMRRSLYALGVTGAGALLTYSANSHCAGEKHPMDALWDTIESRRGADASTSWTAKLLSKGVEKCAQKVGEEATETVIEAVLGRKEGLVKESADLLYHLQVTWAAAGITPEDVYNELRRREGTSGIVEKAARPK